MAYTVASSFDEFYTNINLSGDHRETANTRKDDIVKSLKNNFSILDSFSTGSIPRYTALKDNADLDVFVVLHYGKHVKGKKPSEVLQTVRDSLAEYRTNVRKNGQAVTLYYKTWPNVDIVPTLRIVDSAGKVISYEIPNMNDESWISTNPKIHANNITSRASLCGSNFRRIITMIKWWNLKHSKFLQSYHVEVLALNIFTAQLYDITWDVFTFFDKASELIKNSLWYDISYADSYLDWQSRNEVQTRLESARDKARDAWYYTFGERNDHETAIKLWKQLFGDKFPSYG